MLKISSILISFLLFVIFLWFSIFLFFVSSSIELISIFIGPYSSLNKLYNSPDEEILSLFNIANDFKKVFK